MKTRGPYVRLSVNHSDDARVLEAGPLGELLHLRILQFCQRNLTDGFVTAPQLRRATGDLAALAGDEDLIDTLARVGLLTTEDGGFRVRSWAAWNEAADDIRAKADERRASEAERQRKHRAKARGDHDQTDPPKAPVTSSSRRDAVVTGNLSRATSSSSSSSRTTNPSEPTAASAGFTQMETESLDRIRALRENAKVSALDANACRAVVAELGAQRPDLAPRVLWLALEACAKDPGTYSPRRLISQLDSYLGDAKRLAADRCRVVTRCAHGAEQPCGKCLAASASDAPSEHAEKIRSSLGIAS